MIGGEKRRVPTEDGSNGRMSFKFPVQKLADQIAVPPQGMTKLPVKGEIPFIKVFCFHIQRVKAVDG